MDAERLRRESLRIASLTFFFSAVKAPETSVDLDAFIDGAIRASGPMSVSDAHELKEAVINTLDLLLSPKPVGERLN